jgi:hypothetical protein
MLLLRLLTAQQYSAEETQAEFFLPFHTWPPLTSSKAREMLRRALHHPSNESAFPQLFISGQDDALITMCGFYHASFANLHTKFQIQFEKYIPYTSKDGWIRKVRTQRQEARKTSFALIHSLFEIGVVMDQNLRFLCGIAGDLWPYPRTTFSLASIFPSPFGESVERWHTRKSDSPYRLGKSVNFEATIAAKCPALTNCWWARMASRSDLRELATSSTHLRQESWSTTLKMRNFVSVFAIIFCGKLSFKAQK